MTLPAACLFSEASGHGTISTGKERDTESGNDYFGARYYSSAVGRFMTPDWSAKVEPVPYSKLDDPQSLNLYAYVMNNPMTRIDADGHAPLSWGGFEDCSERSDCNGGGQTFLEQFNNMFAKIEAAAAAAQQQNVQEGINNQLKYKTVSGGQGQNPWEIKWSLTHNTQTGGWIVQHIVADFEDSPQCGGHGQCDYWEAWPVDPHSHTPSIQGVDANGNLYSDAFTGGDGSHIHASARFYEGLKLPDNFKRQPDGFPAGILRATTENPHLPTVNATLPNVRWWMAP